MYRRVPGVPSRLLSAWRRHLRRRRPATSSGVTTTSPTNAPTKRPRATPSRGGMLRIGLRRPMARNLRLLRWITPATPTQVMQRLQSCAAALALLVQRTPHLNHGYLLPLDNAAQEVR